MGKRKKVLLCSILVLAYLRPNLMTVKAELEKFNNFTVTIDRVSDDIFNEKIEVYVEKNEEYFGDYDLNRYNDYCYKTELGTGSYRIYARVRYDQGGIYTVEPQYQDIVVKNSEYQDMHTVIFSVSGGESDESEEHEYGNEGGKEPEISSDIYTIERIDELRVMQESAREQAEQAFEENEKWERDNNFLTQKGVAELEGSGHVYPTEPESSERESLKETENLKIMTESETEPPDDSENKEKEARPEVLIMIAAAILAISVVVGLHLRSRNAERR